MINEASLTLWTKELKFLIKNSLGNTTKEQAALVALEALLEKYLELTVSLPSEDAEAKYKVCKYDAWKRITWTLETGLSYEDAANQVQALKDQPSSKTYVYTVQKVENPGMLDYND